MIPILSPSFFLMQNQIINYFGLNMILLVSCLLVSGNSNLFLLEFSVILLFVRFHLFFFSFSYFLLFVFPLSSFLFPLSSFLFLPLLLLPSPPFFSPFPFFPPPPPPPPPLPPDSSYLRMYSIWFLSLSSPPLLLPLA